MYSACKTSNLLFTLLIIPFLTTCQPGEYGLHDSSTAPYNFTKSELIKLYHLRDTLIKHSNRFILSSYSQDEPSYNILLDSICMGRWKGEEKNQSLYSFKVTDLKWAKDEDIRSTVTAAVRWDNKSNNNDTTYIIKSQQKTSIFSKEGEQLFSFPSIDTIANNVIVNFSASYFFLDAYYDIGCFVLHRNNLSEKKSYFRIYSLRGSPLTTWKLNSKHCNIDPYLQAYIYRSHNQVSITSFGGDTIFSRYFSQIRSLFPGVYHIENNDGRNLLINFSGKSVSVRRSFFSSFEPILSS